MWNVSYYVVLIKGYSSCVSIKMWSMKFPTDTCRHSAKSFFVYKKLKEFAIKGPKVNFKQTYRMNLTYPFCKIRTIRSVSVIIALVKICYRIRNPLYRNERSWMHTLIKIIS